MDDLRNRMNTIARSQGLPHYTHGNSNLINLLLDSEAEMIRETEDFYLPAMLNTAPCDREKAEYTAAQSQKLTLKAAPRQFIWFDSPHKAAVALLLLACYSSSNHPTEGPFAGRKGAWREMACNALKRGRTALERQYLTPPQFGLTRPRDDELLARIVSGQLENRRLTRLSNCDRFVRSIHSTIIDDIMLALQSDDAMNDWLDTWSQLAEQLKRDKVLHMPALISVERLRQSLQNMVTEIEEIAQALQLLASVGQHSALAVCAADCIANLGAPCSTEAQALAGPVLHCGWSWTFHGVCLMSDRPSQLHFDDRFRPHHDTDFAIRYADGWGLHALHGIPVPQFVISGDFNAQDIEKEENLERRRVMTDRYGYERYIKEIQLEPVQRDQFGTLYRKVILGDEPLVVVEVENSTSEPDGTYKKYFLRVHPQVRSAHAAVAWTFGMQSWDYEPLVQT